MHRITLIPGDGIGPEVASAVVRVIEAAGVEIEWETHYAGALALEKFGDTLPNELLESIKRNKVAEEYPEIKADDIIVDNASMQLVMRPEQFDILLCENLYGDIVSDLCAGLIGGLGLVPGANIGEKSAVFEAVHGSAPDIAGKGIANPTAMLQSAILMLNHIEERVAADQIETAMLKGFEEGKVRTRDIGGTATTNEFADAIIERLGI